MCIVLLLLLLLLLFLPPSQSQESPAVAAILDSNRDLRPFPNPEFFGKSFHVRIYIQDTYAIKNTSEVHIIW